MLAGKGQVDVKEVPVPSLKRGDLLVEMRACGLCGSDLEKLSGEYTAAPPVLGHEAVGVVTDVGDEVEGLAPGDRVFPHHHVSCRICAYCRAGSPTMCPDYRKYHLDPGGFAEFFRVPAWNVSGGGVLPLPDGMDFDVASFIEPLACIIRAVGRLGIQEGETALIVGGGPMGMLLLDLLPPLRVGGRFVSEPSPFRRKMAEAHGADAVLDPREVDLPAEVRGLTDGRGADVVFLASGSPAALESALESVRPGGRVGLVGIPESGARVKDAAALVTREVSLISSNAATEVETALALAILDAGQVGVADLVTHRVPLSDLHRGVELARTAEAMKVLVVPDNAG